MGSNSTVDMNLFMNLFNILFIIYHFLSNFTVDMNLFMILFYHFS